MIYKKFLPKKFVRSDNEFGRIDRDKRFIGNFFQKFGRSDNESRRIDTENHFIGNVFQIGWTEADSSNLEELTEISDL